MEEGLYIKYIVEVFFIAAAVAAIMAPISIRLAHRLDIIDRPRDDRRIHERPIPRFGGLSIMIGSMAAMIIPAGMNSKIQTAMIGGILMYLLGAMDDIKNLKPIVKFVGQTGIATLMYAMGIRISFMSKYIFAIPAGVNTKMILNDTLSFVITVLWIVGITNAVNLMDGMDGLAAGATMIMALSMAYVAYIHGIRLGMVPVCIALVAVAGGCAGFLPFNFYPAKTFMGDGGALYLGYMIAVLSVISPLKRATFVGAIIPMLALAVPIFDTAFAMIRRIARHESIMKADKGHLHHHLLAAGFGQRRSVFIIYGIVGIMGVVSILLSRELYIDAALLAAYAFLYLLIIVIPKRSLDKIAGKKHADAEDAQNTEHITEEKEKNVENIEEEGL